MTPEAYIAAVKSHPRVVARGFGGFLYHGHAIRREGDQVAVIPDFLGKDNLRAFAERSTPEHLYASSGCWDYAGQILYGELPSKERVRAYFVSKHGELRGLNWLFPSRIERPAAVEWFEEQLEKQDAQRKEQEARDLWERYYYMFDERHVSAMSGAEFERFVGKLYARLGYNVSFTQGGADQGVDLILCKDGRKIAVQAKRWNGSVGNKAVQEAIAGKLYYGCSHGMIVTTSTFSNSAVVLAAKDPTISLVDGTALRKLCEQFKTEPIPEFSWDGWEKIRSVAERFA
jgi:hypothetical protein